MSTILLDAAGYNRIVANDLLVATRIFVSIQHGSETSAVVMWLLWCDSRRALTDACCLTPVYYSTDTLRYLFLLIASFKFCLRLQLLPRCQVEILVF